MIFNYQCDSGKGLRHYWACNRFSSLLRPYHSAIIKVEEQFNIVRNIDLDPNGKGFERFRPNCPDWGLDDLHISSCHRRKTSSSFSGRWFLRTRCWGREEAGSRVESRVCSHMKLVKQAIDRLSVAGWYVTAIPQLEPFSVSASVTPFASVTPHSSIRLGDSSNYLSLISVTGK